jgi:hypothetical protein
MIPSLDSFSVKLQQLRAKKAELHVEIAKKKAECAVIRARMQKVWSTPEAPNSTGRGN